MKWARKITLIVLMLLAIAIVLRAQKRANTIRKAQQFIDVDSRQRMYLLHVPSKLEPSAALVFVFHGGSRDALDAEHVSGFDEYADRNHFIVAYPDGVDHSWSDGRGTTKAEKEGADDVKFIRALTDKIQKQYSIDPKRIYATGMSNGGFMSHRLGCDMADVFAAIGPVIAGLPNQILIEVSSGKTDFCDCHSRHS